MVSAPDSLKVNPLVVLWLITLALIDINAVREILTPTV